jgi:hypothetical protein
MTWARIVWSGLIIVWAIAGGANSASHNHEACENARYITQEVCEHARNAGAGIGIALILFVGSIGFVSLSLIWFMTKPREVVVIREGDQS